MCCEKNSHHGGWAYVINFGIITLLQKHVFRIGGIGVCEMSTRADPSFPEELGTNNFIFELVLSNSLSYNLHSFAYELVYLEKSSLSKLACVE